MRCTLFNIIGILLTLSPTFGQSTYRNWTIKSDNKNNIALIIANNHYENNGQLIHPIPTAKKLKNHLSKLDFDIMEGHDLNRTQMHEIISDFANRLKDYKFGMVLYMGHGFQIRGNNYLIPIDANPKSLDDVDPQALKLEYLLYKLNFQSIPKIVVLDACRDNPFESAWKAESRFGLKEGFSELLAPQNAEIYFSTQKNSQVRDDNPFMQYLMEEMQIGTCFDDILRNVGRKVLANSKRSIPARYGLLLTDVCLGNRINPSPIIDDFNLELGYYEGDYGGRISVFNSNQDSIEIAIMDSGIEKYVLAEEKSYKMKWEATGIISDNFLIKLNGSKEFTSYRGNFSPQRFKKSIVTIEPGIYFNKRKPESDIMVVVSSDSLLMQYENGDRSKYVLKPDGLYHLVYEGNISSNVIILRGTNRSFHKMFFNGVRSIEYVKRD